MQYQVLPSVIALAKLACYCTGCQIEQHAVDTTRTDFAALSPVVAVQPVRMLLVWHKNLRAPAVDVSQLGCAGCPHLPEAGSAAMTGA